MLLDGAEGGAKGMAEQQIGGQLGIYKDSNGIMLTCTFDVFMTAEEVSEEIKKYWAERVEPLQPKLKTITVEVEALQVPFSLEVKP